MKQRYRRASEIGEYVFCHRAWWLHQVQGHQPANRAALQKGEAAHARHSRTLRAAAILRRAALLLVLAAALLLLAWWLGWL